MIEYFFAKIAVRKVKSIMWAYIVYLFFAIIVFHQAIQDYQTRSTFICHKLFIENIFGNAFELSFLEQLIGISNSNNIAKKL